jgi:hypothetical protein
MIKIGISIMVRSEKQQLSGPELRELRPMIRPGPLARLGPRKRPPKLAA